MAGPSVFFLYNLTARAQDIGILSISNPSKEVIALKHFSLPHGLVPLLALALVKSIVGINISWGTWFIAFLPLGILLILAMPLLAYWFYPPEVKVNNEVPLWAARELEKLGKLSRNEILLLVFVCFALMMWIFAADWIEPALAALLPTEKNPVVVLDAGANVDCRPYHLFQFGLMGDAFARDLLGYAAPRVSLLSIGEEEGKGNSQVKEAYELLKLAQNLNFVGNAEGRDIFTGDIDVVVCDGFVGNVVVKMSEGLASALVRMLKRLFTSGFLPALGGMLAKGAFKKFATTIDYAEYGGAPLLGLQGLAIVCHGRSSARAMQNAIKMAGTFVRKGTNDRLAETILANEELTRFSRAI